MCRWRHPTSKASVGGGTSCTPIPTSKRSSSQTGLQVQGPAQASKGLQGPAGGACRRLQNQPRRPPTNPKNRKNWRAAPAPRLGRPLAGEVSSWGPLEEPQILGGATRLGPLGLAATTPALGKTMGGAYGEWTNRAPTGSPVHGRHSSAHSHPWWANPKQRKKDFPQDALHPKPETLNPEP